MCVSVGLQEPALNVLGQTVEKLTNGSFTQSMLVWAVAMGVGFGVCVCECGLSTLVHLYTHTNTHTHTYTNTHAYCSESMLV